MQYIAHLILCLTLLTTGVQCPGGGGRGGGGGGGGGGRGGGSRGGQGSGKLKEK